MAAAAQSPILTGLRIEGLPDAAQINLIIDRDKADTFGVTFANINAALSDYVGSSFVNQFPNAGRLQRVLVQADQGDRMQADDLLKLNVRNAQGGMVPLGAFARIDWSKGPLQVVAYNGYPAIRISGGAAPGYSSGTAIKEMERLASDLPNGFGYEWTGQSLQEIQSGAQAPYLMGLTVLFVFLLLSARSLHRAVRARDLFGLDTMVIAMVLATSVVQAVMEYGHNDRFAAPVYPLIYYIVVVEGMNTPLYARLRERLGRRVSRRERSPE